MTAAERRSLLLAVARRRRPFPLAGYWPPRRRRGCHRHGWPARPTALLAHTRTHTVRRPQVIRAQCDTVRRRAEQRYHRHGQAAAHPDRCGDPVLLRWRPNRCRARPKQTLRTHARQEEHRYAVHRYYL